MLLIWKGAGLEIDEYVFDTSRRELLIRLFPRDVIAIELLP